MITGTVSPAPGAPTSREPHSFAAAHSGLCAACENWFQEDELITRAPTGWAHAVCPEEKLSGAVGALCARFLESDRDAQGWTFLYPDESQWESPDCDVMSERFLRHAKASGFDSFLVSANSVDDGTHWFTVICEPGTAQAFAVDWTARQFWNAGHPAPATDPGLIPCPLVFEWPGGYPLDVVEFQPRPEMHLNAPSGST